MQIHTHSRACSIPPPHILGGSPSRKSHCLESHEVFNTLRWQRKYSQPSDVCPGDYTLLPHCLTSHCYLSPAQPEANVSEALIKRNILTCPLTQPTNSGLGLRKQYSKLLMPQALPPAPCRLLEIQRLGSCVQTLLLRVGDAGQVNMSCLALESVGPGPGPHSNYVALGELQGLKGITEVV